ncbi:MAG: hypothetical protein PHD88_06510 [Firmicutes bacterium]|nr:hypothetical protein [Bacillota bacterium]MDD4264558.1 hypothetical protein [Bacillota bacterium]MDD4694031.1 hypothetical protein [Bacillota bacterium]
MKNRILALIAVVLLLSIGIFAEDILIYEANFDKTDDRSVDWDPVVGDWEVYDGGLSGYDLSNTNTIASQELEQLGDHVFIYEYKVNYDISGGQWSPAAGLHFMASDGYDVNRGESYLVFQDYGRVQLYRASAGTLTHVTQVEGYPAIEGHPSVIRVEYDVKAGIIDVYLDGNSVLQWVDPNPIFDGDFISVRTNMTAVTYDYIKVWVRK